MSVYIPETIVDDALTCKLCGRYLDRENDPLSLDCGGDCLGCMITIEGDDDDCLKKSIDTLTMFWLNRVAERAAKNE